MDNILCFCPVLGDTKDSKRVEILQKAGYSVTVMCFERDYFSSRLPDCEIVKLGKIENGKYLKRALVMLYSLIKLRKISKGYDMVYALSPDLAFMSYLSLLFIKKPIVMDVADIREIQVAGGISGTIVRLMDKFIAGKVDLVVVTSEAFIHEYYRKKLGANIKDFFLLENKVDYVNDLRLDSKYLYNKHRISIGYFGVLRDNWTVEFLLNLLKRYPNTYNVVVAGINMIDKFDLKALSSEYENFNYLGPFKSPHDLTNLYKQVDVLAVFYPEFSGNSEWFEARKLCRTNRYYEALFFSKPIIAFAFSEDGRLVKKLNIGITLDSYDIGENVSKIAGLMTRENLLKWRNNIDSQPESTYCFTDESDRLNKKISEIVKL